ncbi:MAG: tetratricopeptide repeat protein, partial [Gammaproteobacteria bacterium]|nr:tetratricopeptide repeat protein [Gammaproteobacteria bacterium]
TLAVLFFVLQGQSAGRLGSSVQIPPVAGVEQTASDANSLDLPEAELIAQAAAAAAQSVAQEATQTLSQLEARLQQLEAQNLALLESQRREAELSGTTTASAPVVNWGGSNNSAPSAQTQAQLQDSEWIDPDWANAPALPADVVETSTNAASTAQLFGADPAAAMNRVPREMSLQDRDRQAVQFALQQWSSGQRLAALQTLDVFSYENPEAHGARETLAKLLIQQGEPERAMQAVELGLSIAPNNNAYKKVKARLDIEQGRADEALQMLSAAPPAVSADTEYHDLMATAFLTTQQYDFASVTYQAMLQQNPAEGRWWYGLAASYDARGMTQDAAQAYERALQQINLSPSLRQASQARVQLIRQSSAAR